MGEFNKRKYIRYPAEPNALVTIYYTDESTRKTCQHVGMGQNECFNGCCVVFVGEIRFKEGHDVFCESVLLHKMKAKVAWIKKLDDQITKAGFTFTE